MMNNGDQKKRIYNKALYLLVAASLLPVAAYAEPFQEALESTYATNPRIKAERENLKALDESVAQAVSGWRPTATTDYARGRQRNSFADADWSYTENILKQLVVDQPIFSGGETWARTKSAKKLVKAGRAQLESTEQDVLLDAVEAYMDVVQAQSVVELSKTNAEVLRQQLQATQDRFDVGEVTRTDTAQSEARVSRSEADYIQAQGNLESARAVFKRVVGYEPGTLPMPPVSTNIPINLEEALQVAMAENPNLEVAKFRQESADYDVNVRVADILPDVFVRGSMRREDGAGIAGNSNFDTDALTMNVRMPLYQSGAEYSRVREAKNIFQRRKFDYLDTTDAVREAVTRAWEQYQTSNSTIRSNEAAIGAADIALEGVKQEQQYGARTTLDVLDAEQELFLARVNLIRSQRDSVVSLYNLYAVMGQLNPQKLALKVETYDPTVHYDDVKYKMIGF